MMMKSLQARARMLACGVLLGGGRLDSCARRETGGDLGLPEGVGRIFRGWRERSGEIPDCLGDLVGKQCISNAFGRKIRGAGAIMSVSGCFGRCWCWSTVN